MNTQILRNAIILSILFSLLPLVVSAEDDHSIEIIVEKGDNLYTICEKILENPEDWRWVAMVNRIKNPRQIFPGQKLIIPTRLLMGVPVDGIVTFVKGDASIKLKGAQEWKALQLNDTITQGDRIRTGSVGGIEITFENDFSILLRPGTTLEITAARKKSAAYLLYKLFLDIGKTISRIKKSTGKETRFEIQTPSAVAAARGTEFRAGVDADITTRLEVLAGKVNVQAARKEVEVKAGEGTAVKKDKPPAIPKKLLPPPPLMNLLPLYREMPLEFRFEIVPGATTYRIMLAGDKTFKDVVRNQVIKPQESLKITGIEDGTYYLQSRSIDDLGLEGPSSEPLEIKVRINPLPPFIQSPSDGADFSHKTARFEWLKVTQAVRYHLQVAEDRKFQLIVAEAKNITDISHEMDNLDFNTYYFRVRSIAEDGYEGIWSDTLSFNIIPPPPSPPVEKPEIGDKELRVRWRDLGDGITYHFQMAKDQAFEEVLIDKKLSKPEITFEKPGDVGTYYVRTSAMDRQGYEGGFSEPQTFEVKEKYPYLSAGIMVLVILAIIIM